MYSRFSSSTKSQLILNQKDDGELHIYVRTLKESTSKKFKIVVKMDIDLTLQGAMLFQSMFFFLGTCIPCIVCCLCCMKILKACLRRCLRFRPNGVGGLSDDDQNVVRRARFMNAIQLNIVTDNSR